MSGFGVLDGRRAERKSKYLLRMGGDDLMMGIQMLCVDVGVWVSR